MTNQVLVDEDYLLALEAAFILLRDHIDPDVVEDAMEIASWDQTVPVEDLILLDNLLDAE